MNIATTKLSSRGQIVIPVELRGNLKEGENLVIIRCKEGLLIKKEDEITYDWNEVTAFADETLLAESWDSSEDEKAFAYLQKKK